MGIGTWVSVCGGTYQSVKNGVYRGQQSTAPHQDYGVAKGMRTYQPTLQHLGMQNQTTAGFKLRNRLGGWGWGLIPLKPHFHTWECTPLKHKPMDECHPKLP